MGVQFIKTDAQAMVSPRVFIFFVFGLSQGITHPYLLENFVKVTLNPLNFSYLVSFVSESIAMFVSSFKINFCTCYYLDLEFRPRTLRARILSS